jgi:cellulose synthase/poly-beta-1,6-N-acetylglucosamine synthase-like glycosyltransferase
MVLVKFFIPKKGTNTEFTNDTELPYLSIIITAHNEESRIREKIENTLRLEYPQQLLEIIIASDGSTDNTNKIIQEYSCKGISFVCPIKRLGKENAQKEAIDIAKGDVLVFSDVATKIPENSLRLLARYFSEDRLISTKGAIAGESIYVKYEMWLRQQESKLAGLIGLSGSFFAARKEICSNWDVSSPSDFNTALNCKKFNLRAITAPDVLGYYPDLKDSSKEYNRKIRTVIRGMTALAKHPEIINPFKYRLFSFQVFSHKLMRWIEPWFLLGLFITNFALISESVFFLMLLVLQVLFYGIAILTHYNYELQKYRLIKIIYFFVQANLALMDASLKFLTGQRMTTWKPSSR